MVSDFEEQIKNCKTNIIEWCYDISKAPTDGTEIIAWDDVDFFTCVFYRNGKTFVRSSYGEPIDIGCYYSTQYDQVHIRKWAYIPK